MIKSKTPIADARKGINPTLYLTWAKSFCSSFGLTPSSYYAKYGCYPSI